MKKVVSLKIVGALLAMQVGFKATTAHANNNGPQILIAYGMAVAMMIMAGSSSKSSHAAELVQFNINAETSAALKTELGDTAYFGLLNEMAVGSSSSVLVEKYSGSKVAQEVIGQYAQVTRH